jgi:hypothetical protein
MSQDMTEFTDRAGVDGEEKSDAEGRLETRRSIAFGMDMEAFLASQVGRYLEARAQVEIKHLRASIDDMDPSDERKIRDLQQAISSRKLWKEWITIAIQEGAAQQDIAVDRGVL